MGRWKTGRDEGEGKTQRRNDATTQRKGSGFLGSEGRKAEPTPVPKPGP